MKNWSILLVFLLVLSCGQTTQIQKDTMRIAVPVEARSLYPYTANDPHSSRVFSQIFDTLITRDAEGNFLPSLAESWEFISPTVFELKIRPNVLFHNGEILTVEDVQFSYERILSTPNLAHTVNEIDRTEIVDSNTFRVVLKEPYAPILPLLSYSTFKILNKKAILESGDRADVEPVGTGAFMLKEWNRGQNIKLERFENAWNGEAKIRFLDFRTVQDPVARALAVETKDVDIAYDIEGSDRERLLGNENVVLSEREIPRVEYIAMNIGQGTNPLWKDPRGRQAFSYAIDKDGIIDSILFNQGKKANSLLPPTLSGYNTNLAPSMRNVEKAKELIQSLGIENPRMTIWVREGVSQKVGEVLQANLAEIGVEAEIEIVEYARFLEGIAKGEHDVFILNWTTITGDADYGLNNLLNSEAWGSKGNRSFYSNSEIDTLLAEARTDLNESSRIDKYFKIQELLIDEVPYIPLYYAVLTVALSPDVTGFTFDMFGDYPMKDISFKN